MQQERLSHGFGPYIDSESRTLILGSFPSVKSREAAFFYGHPQNRFYPVLERVFEDNIVPVENANPCLAGEAGLSSAAGGADAIEAANNAAVIAAKKAFLKRHHIALYDVIESCAITGSSDSSIRDVVPADIMALLNAAPIERIFVNGKTAKKYYDKYLYTLCGQTAVCLPSTSPANAAWNLEKLIAEWKIVAKPEVRYVDSMSNFYADKDTRDGYLIFPVSGETGLPLIRFHSFDKIAFVDAAFTTRFGGVSKGVLGSLNLGFNRGDGEAELRMNWKRCAAAMNCSLEQMIATNQVHGTEILRAEEGMGLGTGLAPEAGNAFHTGEIRNSAGEACAEPDCLFHPRVTSVDGFWCDTPGLALCASFADCVPVYLVDPVGRRVSLVHSGWKGTAGQIAGKAVRILEKQGSLPTDIVAVIGPSISGAHYEVTADVIEKFVDTRQLAQDAGFSPYSGDELSDIYVQTDAKHYHLDLWAAIYYTLVHAGVRPENIHFSGICTWENADVLWSHRRSGGRRGNMNAFLKIRN